jgi:hypothetical protein
MTSIAAVDGDTMYDKMKRRGVDMSWYDKSKRTPGATPRVIPLNDGHCGRLSIYLLTKPGKLFTITADGKPYHQVRQFDKKVAKDIYMCMHCKGQWDTVEEADKHYGKA